jgi:ketosteroid isomerase-like protein
VTARERAPGSAAEERAVPTATRETVLIQALEAAVAGDGSRLEETFTEDVVGWSPNLAVASRAELAEEFGERHDALSNVVISFDAVYLVGDNAIAEWRIGADHTGQLVIGDELAVDPTGRRVELAGATFAEFRGDQICAFRNYFDDAALLEQLLLAE